MGITLVLLANANSNDRKLGYMHAPFQEMNFFLMYLVMPNMVAVKIRVWKKAAVLFHSIVWLITMNPGKVVELLFAQEAVTIL